jgi:hypothetical protein
MWRESLPQVPAAVSPSATQFQCYTEIVARKNVTLTISEETLRKAKHLAIESGVSLSKFLSDHLEALVARDEKYEEARRRSLARMKRGLDLGIGAEGIQWSRDDLYER